MQSTFSTIFFVAVADFNLLLAETDTAGDISLPAAEWLSSIRTPSQMSNSSKACLLFDLYLEKDVFHRVSFEIIYRSADAEEVEKRLLFFISNDGVANRVEDVFEFSLDSAVSHYQVIICFVVSCQCHKPSCCAYRCYVRRCWVWLLAAYRRTHSPGRLVWSEGRRPLGAVPHSS